jgi:SprT-like family
MKTTTPEETITQAEYRAFQDAYDFFNTELFADSLPPVLVTLQRHAKTYGYFSPDRFVGRTEKEAAHELALNPDHFGRSDELILSVLVHEMAHVWQKTHGKMPQRGYHDRQWAEKMRQIGLQPSSTNEPGGKETGPHMGHYVIEGGPFARAFAKLQATGFRLRWQSRTQDDPTRKAKKASKTKFTCPECAQNAWAKPDAQLICGACYEDGEGEIRLMLAEPQDEAEAA